MICFSHDIQLLKLRYNFKSTHPDLDYVTIVSPFTKGEIRERVKISNYLAIIQGFIGWFMLTIFSVSLISQLFN